MTSFTIIVSPFAFLGLGSLVDSVANYLETKIAFRRFGLIFRTLTVVFICFFVVNLSKIANYHTGWKPDDNCNRKCEFDEMRFIATLQDRLKNEKYVVFNARARFNGHIPVMFYTNYVAYDIVPTEKQLTEVRSKGYKIAILDNDSLPGYIVENAGIVKVRN